MLLITTNNATATIETILAGTACVGANEPCGRSVGSVQFADWQPAHRLSKRMHMRSMCASGYPTLGLILPDSLPRCPGDAVSKRRLRSVIGCHTVS